MTWVCGDLEDIVRGKFPAERRGPGLQLEEEFRALGKPVRVCDLAGTAIGWATWDGRRWTAIDDRYCKADKHGAAIVTHHRTFAVAERVVRARRLCATRWEAGRCR